MEARKPMGLNTIAKIGYCHLCLREETTFRNFAYYIFYYILVKTFSKHSKYVVNQKLEHVDISFRELFGRTRVVFFYKIRSVPS